ncbi:hypothetical protein [Pseudoalteromonas rubra]|uniref:Uncharacterized protein n=1 Tax=Pseudoalteromonas rubra TaxID=43658 RepID=A0A0U3HV70_9GAMM|nr:hypothetical protein [Pseudoalteromonas rubra]ALU41478.1 hypothetical protein AT705_00175 [Pseudoalteromonas rubra]
MKKPDPGFDANLSVLLSAYHAKSKVIARGHDDQIWGGSSGRYCLLYSIELYLAALNSEREPHGARS